MDEEHQATMKNLSDQMTKNNQNQEQIQHLQKKIDNFSSNQTEVSFHFIIYAFSIVGGKESL